MRKCRYCNFIYNDDLNNFCVKCGRSLKEAASKYMVINVYGKKLVDEKEFKALNTKIDELNREVSRLREMAKGDNSDGGQNALRPVAYLIVRQNDDLSVLPVNPGKNLYANRMSLKESPIDGAQIIRGMFRQKVRFAIYTNDTGFSIQSLISGIKINSVTPGSLARLHNDDKISFTGINNFEIIFSRPTTK